MEEKTEWRKTFDSVVNDKAYETHYLSEVATNIKRSSFGEIHIKEDRIEFEPREEDIPKLQSLAKKYNINGK